MTEQSFSTANALEGLHGVLLPAPVRYTPQTIGWLIVAIIVLAAVAWWGYRRYRFWLENRYRDVALTQLALLEARVADAAERVAALTELPVLVKQTALQRYPREQVAELSGKEWLMFLNKSYGGNDFTEGVGALLPSLAYQSPFVLEQIPDRKIDELLELLKNWIQTHGVVE